MDLKKPGSNVAALLPGNWEKSMLDCDFLAVSPRQTPSISSPHRLLTFAKN
jgi:hypothetical protein